MRQANREPKRQRRAFLHRLIRDSRGGTAIEYGLILALLTLTMIGSFVELANVTTGMWNNVSDKVSKAR